MKIKQVGLSLFFIIGFYQLSCFACDSFMLKGNDDQIVFGYHWQLPLPPDKVKPSIMINKRDTFKTAYMPWNDNPVKWTSKYGSITFTPISKDFPLCGINEKGLYVSETTYTGMRFPKPDSKPAVSTLQWIQYQLDTSASVAETIKSLKDVRITEYTPIYSHLYIADKSGDSAVIEYLNGQATAYTNGKKPTQYRLPTSNMSNGAYEVSIATLLKFYMDTENKGFGFELNEYGKLFRDFKRFVIVACYLNNYKHLINKPDIIDYSFAALKASDDHTIFTVVIDPIKQDLYYNTALNSKIKKLDYKGLDYENNLMIEMNADFKDQKDVIRKFTVDKNKEIVDCIKIVRDGFKLILPDKLWPKADQIFDTWHNGIQNYIKKQYSNN